MSRLLTVSKVICLWSVVVFMLTLSWVSRELVRELINTRDSLVTQIDQLRKHTTEEIRITNKTLNREMTKLSEHTRRETSQLREQTLALINERTGSLDAQLVRSADAVVALTTSYAELPRSLQPWMDCRGNGACLPALAAGTMGAARATLGEWSRTSRLIREQTPEYLDATRSSVVHASETSRNVAVATQSLVGLLGNLQKATKPLPWWGNLGLKIAVPAATIATPFVLR